VKAEASEPHSPRKKACIEGSVADAAKPEGRTKPLIAKLVAKPPVLPPSFPAKTRSRSYLKKDRKSSSLQNIAVEGEQATRGRSRNKETIKRSSSAGRINEPVPALQPAAKENQKEKQAPEAMDFKVKFEKRTDGVKRRSESPNVTVPKEFHFASDQRILRRRSRSVERNLSKEDIVSAGSSRPPTPTRAAVVAAPLGLPPRRPIPVTKSVPFHFKTEEVFAIRKKKEETKVLAEKPAASVGVHRIQAIRALPMKAMNKE